jgi:PPOX class probable F420-dependent enzyme
MLEPDEKQRAILAGRRIASVATIGADGAPHLTSVWFLYEEGAIYLAVPSSSVKARNLAGNPQIAVMVDVRVSYREAGLTAIGEAEILRGKQAASVAGRIHRKYLTGEAMQDPRVGPVFEVVDDVAIRLVPRKWISWDMGALDQQAFDGTIARQRYLRAIEP